MKSYWMVLLVGLCMLAVAAPTVAHHSTAMYNNQKSLTITGVVKRFEWTNPHAFIYVEVKDEATGNLGEWEVKKIRINHPQPHDL